MKANPRVSAEPKIAGGTEFERQENPEISGGSTFWGRGVSQQLSEVNAAGDYRHARWIREHAPGKF